MALYANGSEVSTLKAKVGGLSRVMDDADGSVSYDGVGFQPTAMWFWCVENVQEYWSVGWSDAGATGGSNVCSYHNYEADTMTYNKGNRHTLSLRTGTGSLYGQITSFDADGFTIYWSMGGSETGTAQVGWLAIG